MEAKDAEMEAKLGQIQEKDAEIDRQQREMQTLRVRTCDYNKATSLYSNDCLLFCV